MTLSRRYFVVTSVLAPVATGLASQIASATAPALLTRGLNQNSKMRVLKVGCGGMGRSDLNEVASHKMV